MTQNAPVKAFTAAQIAAAIGKTPQGVRRQLAAVRPAGTKIVSGNETAVFALEQLPANLRMQIEDAARRQNYRYAEALLAAPSEKWKPEIPMDQISDGDIQAAARLRDALRPFLIQQHNPDLSRAEIERLGVEDYRRVFGNTITTRYWRELFMRTIRRDNGAEDWNRLEIYLHDRVKRKETPAAAASEALKDAFTDIEDFISACGVPHTPNETEQRAVWTMALQKYTSLVNAGAPEKNAARRVREYLFRRASFLAASRDALLKAFNRRLEVFKNANGDPKSLRDGRENNGDHFELPDHDRDMLIHRAVFYYRGDVAPAWRDCLSQGFSPEVVSRYAGKAADKSHVPASVMGSIAEEVKLMTIMYQGRRAFDAIKGHVNRSYEGIYSLQCISGDDFTLNTYFYIEDGGDWYQLTRGQVILFIDFRSLKILGWALEPRKSYSSLTIRGLCTNVFAEYGVPQVLYFERGLWKSATLLKGKTDPLTFTEISQGLREFGIEFIHAIRPRTKVIERIGGMFQDIAEAEPGYCGRDERRDAPESLRRQMAEVDARKVHPSKYFYSLDQWNLRIGQLVEKYNAEIQQGRILAGMSPDQAFKFHMNQNDPPIQFSADLRYLLADEKRRAFVTLNGVTIQIGKQRYNYCGQELADRVGQEVLVWFNPKNPQSATITNQDRTDPVSLERTENPSALERIVNPGSGVLGRALAKKEGTAAHIKTRYNIVKSKFPLPQRQLLGAAQAVELGQEITRQKTEITEKAERRQRAHRKAQRLVSDFLNETPEPEETVYQLKPFKKFDGGKGDK